MTTTGDVQRPDHRSRAGRVVGVVVAGIGTLVVSVALLFYAALTGAFAASHRGSSPADGWADTPRVTCRGDVTTGSGIRPPVRC